MDDFSKFRVCKFSDVSIGNKQEKNKHCKLLQAGPWGSRIVNRYDSIIWPPLRLYQ